jgi:Tfp pilus assembly protein PilN
MRDINFFSPYRIAKTRTVDRTLILGAGVLVVGLLVAGAILLVNGQLRTIQREIDTVNQFLESPATVQKLNEASTMKVEVTLLERYLVAVTGARQDVAAKSSIDTELFKRVESTIPAATTLVSFSMQENTLTLECKSPVSTDAMDFIHALAVTNTFQNVAILSITTDPDGFNFFTITCNAKGGVQP